MRYPTELVQISLNEQQAQICDQPGDEDPVRTRGSYLNDSIYICRLLAENVSITISQERRSGSCRGSFRYLFRVERMNFTVFYLWIGTDVPVRIYI